MTTMCRCLVAAHQQVADIWSCGVMLYVMLVGAYPFERPEDKTDTQKLQKMIQVRSMQAGREVWALQKLCCAQCSTPQLCACHR
jgi:serine/threonine protein kinase